MAIFPLSATETDMIGLVLRQLRHERERVMARRIWRAARFGRIRFWFAKVWR
jgi:hypothetical protein